MTRSIRARQLSFIRQQRNVIVVQNVIVVRQNRPAVREGLSQKRAQKCMHILLEQPPTNMCGEFVIRGILNK